MANISALANTVASALGLSGLILASPQKTVGYQPQNAPSFKKDTAAQQPTLIFNYEGEQAVALESDITDHYIENNTSIQDQIALKPETITTHGFVGELNDIAPAALQPLKTIADKLTPVGAYAPALSATAIIAYTEAQFAYTIGANAVNTAVSAWSSINGGGGESVINGAGIASQAKNQTKQQQYFQQFYGYWKSRTLFTIQTPWAVFQDMAIKSLRAVQDAETNVITDFQVTFKLMRFASTTLTENALYGTNSFQGRSAAQSALEVNLGTSTPSLSPISFASQVA